MNKQEFVEAHITASARNVADEMRERGLERTPKVMKVLAVRAVREANEAYDRRHWCRTWFRSGWPTVMFSLAGFVISSWLLFQSNKVAVTILLVFIALGFLGMFVIACYLVRLEREMVTLHWQILEEAD